MKILITGKGGTAGSWKIRGEQLGAALGATVLPMATERDCRAHDVVILVKRTPKPVLDAVRASGRPWVLDLVDGWPQPSCWSEMHAINWLRGRLEELKPDGVVYGTERMRTDARHPGLVLPHHSWSRYVDAAPNAWGNGRGCSGLIVGYEGSAEYLGTWGPALERACAARGWKFQINGDMHQADIGIALRERAGYPGRHWKPGTKLSNLHALGIPALCSREDGYRSVACGSEYWIEEPRQLEIVFGELADAGKRLAIGIKMREAMLRVETVAEDYRRWLTSFI